MVAITSLCERACSVTAFASSRSVTSGAIAVPSDIEHTQALCQGKTDVSRMQRYASVGVAGGAAAQADGFEGTVCRTVGTHAGGLAGFLPWDWPLPVAGGGDDAPGSPLRAVRTASGAR